LSDEIDRLSRRILDGDANAASALLALIYQRIYAYLRRLSGNDSIAEDLMQETFMKVWSSLHRFRGECSITIWIHKIAHNTYIDWYRSHAKKDFIFTSWVDDIEDSHLNPCDDLAKRQEAQRLYHAVERLDEHLRQAVYLHYYQELSLRETSYVLNVAVSTVKYRLRRAIELLKPSLTSE
jgi:RNA polymerase sigma-70 factor, ECF subfamily